MLRDFLGFWDFYYVMLKSTFHYLNVFALFSIQLKLCNSVQTSKWGSYTGSLQFYFLSSCMCSLNKVSSFLLQRRESLPESRPCTRKPVWAFLFRPGLQYRKTPDISWSFEPDGTQRPLCDPAGKPHRAPTSWEARAEVCRQLLSRYRIKTRDVNSGSGRRSYKWSTAVGVDEADLRDRQWISNQVNINTQTPRVKRLGSPRGAGSILK